MATFDQLPADQRAIIELVLQRGQSYDDLADMLGMPASRVRELARGALVELAPATARRVEEDWRGQVADYLLGQQTGPESTATRGHLRRSEAARTWALSLLDSLDPLYGNGTRPEIPEPDARARPPRERRERPARERPARERPARERAGGDGDRPARAALSPEARAVVRRRRIAAALAGAAALVIALLALTGVLFGVGGDVDDEEGGGEQTSTQADQQIQVVGSPIVLRPRGDERGAGSAFVAQRGNERVLVVQARGLAPTEEPPEGAQEGGTAYEVWLYNSPRDARSLGAQVTDAEGNLQGAGPLPDDFDRYRYIDISRERIDREAAHSGTSVLRGQLADLRRPVEGGESTQPAPGGTETAPPNE